MVLFYRLNTFSVFLPPLRERKGEIPILMAHWLSARSCGMGCGLLCLHPVSLRHPGEARPPVASRASLMVGSKAAVRCSKSTNETSGQLQNAFLVNRNGGLRCNYVHQPPPRGTARLLN
jgi:transcriptional regulator with GAF, ATPase, and Fis domain